MLRALLTVIVIASGVRAADVSIVEHGAVADGTTINTQPIQRAIDATAAAGGGRVLVPAGVFRTGAIHLEQDVELYLSEGATLLGSTDLGDYPREMTRIEGHFEEWRPALINARGLDGVSLTGAGTIDGNGRPFWAAFWQRRQENPKCTNLEVERPRLMFLQECRNVRIAGVKLKDSGFWNLHLYRCQQVTVDSISITAPHGDPPQIVGAEQPWDEVSINRAPSSDGIDVDSCQQVTIRNCTISVGDDCIALKGTKGPLALEDAASPPVENILVEDCHFASGHGMLTCGSEATLVRNVVVRRCKVGAGVPVVRLKLRPDTPQLYENMIFEDLMLNEAQALFDVKPWTQFFDLQGHEPPTSHVRQIVLRNVRGSVAALGELRGNPGGTITGVTLEDIDLQTSKPSLVVGDATSVVTRRGRINGKPWSVPEEPSE